MNLRLRRREALLAAGVIGLLAASVWAGFQGAHVAPLQAPQYAAPDSAARQWFATLGTQTAAPVARVVMPEGAGADRGGRLQVNLPLRLMFDLALRHSSANDLAGRGADLAREIDAQFPASAALEAKALAQQYLAYAKEHDAALARQQLTWTEGALPDLAWIERLQAWKLQRARLRQNMLGMQLATTWFSADDEQLDEAIRYLRARNGEVQDDPNESESNRLQAERLRTPVREAAELAMVQEKLADTLRPYLSTTP